VTSRTADEARTVHTTGWGAARPATGDGQAARRLARRAGRGAAALGVALALLVAGRGADAGNIITVAGGGAGGGEGVPATSVPLNQPMGLALDVAGDLLVAEFGDHQLRKVTAATRLITAVAGTGDPGFAGDGEAATGAEFLGLTAVAVDAAGNVFVADEFNNRVRKISVASGIVTTVAGTGTAGYNGDGIPATTAQLDRPVGVAVDAAGNLFIADGLNFRVRRVDAATQVITTVAGTGTHGFGGDDGPAVDAQLGIPSAVAVDASGRLLIADGSNHRVRAVQDGTITTLAGTGTAGSGGDGGLATAAQLDSPEGLAVDAAGNVFIADTGNHRVRRVRASDRVITTLAGTGTAGFSGDDGPAVSAQLAAPTGLALDAGGALFVSDSFNNRVRAVDTDDAVTAAVLVSAPAASTAATSASFTFASPDPAVTYLCRIDGGAFTPCVSGQTYTGLARGPHSFSVRAVDRFGNTRTTTHQWTVVTFVFTDNPLVAQVTTIKAAHVTELREAINSRRARFGLGETVFTDPVLDSTVSPRAVHLEELRTALVEAYTAAGRPAPAFTDPTIVPGETTILAVHFTEIRTAVEALE
jgi:sugar lactone lactonase YvrE